MQLGKTLNVLNFCDVLEHCSFTRAFLCSFQKLHVMHLEVYFSFSKHVLLSTYNQNRLIRFFFQFIANLKEQKIVRSYTECFIINLCSHCAIINWSSFCDAALSSVQCSAFSKLPPGNSIKMQYRRVKFN